MVPALQLLSWNPHHGWTGQDTWHTQVVPCYSQSTHDILLPPLVKFFRTNWSIPLFPFSPKLHHGSYWGPCYSVKILHLPPLLQFWSQFIILQCSLTTIPFSGAFTLCSWQKFGLPSMLQWLLLLHLTHSCAATSNGDWKSIHLPSFILGCIVGMRNAKKHVLLPCTETLWGWWGNALCAR